MKKIDWARLVAAAVIVLIIIAFVVLFIAILYWIALTSHGCFFYVGLATVVVVVLTAVIYDSLK